MKSSINLISMKSLLMLVLCTMTFTLFGQAIPEIETRFANPSYDRDTRVGAVFNRVWTYDRYIETEVLVGFGYFRKGDVFSFTKLSPTADAGVGALEGFNREHGAVSNYHCLADIESAGFLGYFKTVFGVLDGSILELWPTDMTFSRHDIFEKCRRR